MRRFVTRVTLLLLGGLPSLAFGAYSAPTSGALATGTDNASLNTPYPATVGAGDLCFLMALMRDGDFLATPSGWHEISTAGSRVPGFIREAVGNEDGTNLAVGFSGGAGGAAAAKISCFATGATGYDESTLVHAGPIAGSTALSNDILTNPITITVDNTLLLHWGHKVNDIAVPFTSPPTGSTIIEQSNNASNHTHASAYEIQTTATSRGSSSFDSSSADTAAQRAWSVSLLAPDVASPPEFDTVPNITSQTESAYTIAYDGGAIADNVFFALYPHGTAQQTCDDIEAGTGARGTATEAVTGAADSIVITSTDTPELPSYEIQYCLEDGTTDSTPDTLADVAGNLLDPPTGYQWEVLASIGVGSFCEDFNAAINPDLVSGDILGIPTVVKNDAGGGDEALTSDTACQVSYNPNGDFSRRRALNWMLYDTSAQDYHADDIDAWWYDTPPFCSADVDLVWVTNVAIPVEDEIDLDLLCFSDLGDTLTGSVVSGTPPTGTSLVGNKIGSGQTPTVENEAGVLLTLRVTTLTGATADQLVTPFVWTTLALFDCTTTPELEQDCRDAIIAQFLGTLTINSVGVCDSPVVANGVITQDPAAGAEVAPYTSVDLTYSRECVLGGRKYGLGLGHGF